MVPGPTQVLNPNGSSIGAAVFAGLTSVTDRPTDHATRSVRIGRIYARSTTMRPNNKRLQSKNATKKRKKKRKTWLVLMTNSVAGGEDKPNCLNAYAVET